MLKVFCEVFVMKGIEIKKDIYWVGALDPNLRIFDIIMYTPYGTTYNSYVVKGSEKTAVFETVKEQFFDEYLERLKSFNIDVTKIDYIVVNHTEPDHSGSIAKLLKLSPNAKVVGSAAALAFLKDIANEEFDSITATHNDTLSLGNKTLKFISAPFLHWPDSMYTYIEEDNILVTCDSFGSHYSTENIFNDLVENKDHYMEALKYYYDCIFGPFKSYVLQALDKIKDLEIETICPGHGPILRENHKEILELYRQWSTPIQKTSTRKTVIIPYVSAYGYTELLANKIAEGIKSIHDFDVELFNVIYSDKATILEKITNADGVLFGSPTINGDALEPILELLINLNPIVHGKKFASAFGSYGWSGEAVRNIEDRLKQLRMNTIPGLRLKFKPSESKFKLAYEFGQNFGCKILGIQNPSELTESSKEGFEEIKDSSDGINRKWKCLICGIIMESPEVPEICPVCGADSSQFIEIKEDKTIFRNDVKETYVIIGNGAAGYHAAEAIRKRNSLAEIEIISGEKYLTYYRPQLSDLLSSDLSKEEFYVSSEAWYKDNNIKLSLGVYVQHIDTSEKKLLLTGGKEVSYDKLILANGSHNYIPQIKGSVRLGVFTLKDLNDVNQIKEYMEASSNVVVVGGGLLGLEAAWEMKNKGLNVTVVEFQKRLLPRQLDVDGADVFKNSISTCGVNIILGDMVEEIIGDDKVTAVKLSSGAVINTDIVLFSVGIRPNTSLSKLASIPTNKGVLVDKKMQTAIEDIYACGDVAELNSTVYGNWPAAIEMGTVAGRNAVGETVEFKGFISSVIFNSMNTEMFSCGNLDLSLDSYTSKDLEKGIYKRFYFENSKLVGAILLGDTKSSGKIMTAITSGMTYQWVLSNKL